LECRSGPQVSNCFITAYSDPYYRNISLLLSDATGLIQPALHTHTRAFKGPFSGTTRVSRILLKQETVSGSGIHWDICKSAPNSRQITMPVPHHSCFLQAGCPSCRPTNSVNALMPALLHHYCRDSGTMH